ncbi:tetratricopeptide repeat protein [Flavobacteriales bacterium]|nr:tetratricopeptide repeat protein [Flavobacteriales bacterium]
MNKIVFLALTIAVSINVSAQKSNVQNAYKSLKKDKIPEAIEYIELAAKNEATSNDVKMHNYRGLIYFEVHSNPEYRSLDNMAILKCANSWQAMYNHPKVGKWYDDDLISSNITKAGVGLYNKGIELYSEKDFDNSKLLYNKIFDLFPLDESKSLSRSNVTKEAVFLNLYYACAAQGDLSGSKEYLQELIDASYQDPQIYAYMSEIYQKEENTEKALAIIKEGREYFDTDVNLIISELNFYLASEDFVKAEELLRVAVKEDPNNEKLFYALGTSYDQLGDFDKALEAYKEAVDIDPDYYDANYNLGIMCYNKGGLLNNEANDTRDFDKADAIKANAETIMLKGLPYMEACYRLQPDDKNILIVLKELYYRNGDDAKYKEIVSKL